MYRKYLFLPLITFCFLCKAQPLLLATANAGKINPAKQSTSNGANNLASSGIISPSNVITALNWVDEAVIGKTNFDIQTNGTISNRIVKNTDGTISAVWTLSGQNSSYTDRGTGYNYFDPNTSSLWQKGWYNPITGAGPGLVNQTRTEGSYRTGYTNIIVTRSGKEMTVAHSSTSSTMLLNKRNVKGTGSWTQYPNLLNNATGNNYDTWSKGIADGDTIHLIWQGSGTSGLAVNGQAGPIFYSRSTDGGVTWPVLRTVIPAINNTQYRGFDADSYSIDAKNGTVVIAYGDFDTDVGIIKSVDGGNTWTKKIVQRFPIPMYDANTMSTDAYGPNGAGGPDGIPDTLISNGADACVLIDNSGLCHVWFSANRVYSRAPGAGLTFFPLTDGLYYWNESMPTGGYRMVAKSLDMNNDGILNLPSGGACAEPYGYFDGGITQMPSAGIDTAGVLYVTYQSICELCDTNTLTLSGSQARRHIYIITSDNNGSTWSPPKDIIPNVANGGNGEFQEGVYASVARNVDSKVYVLYQRDSQPGNSVSIAGGCDQYNNTAKSDMVLAKVDAAYVRNSYITANINVNSPIKCNGGTANLTVVASGGTPPYTGTGTYTRTAGNYSFTVTDAIGITSTAIISLVQPPPLLATSSNTVIKCNGDSAVVTIQATGGVAPYNGTGTFKHIAGNYSYAVTDSYGCVATASGNISQPASLNAIGTPGIISCNGGTTNLNISATGGISPYSGTGNFTVSAGTFFGLVTDANGCIDTIITNVNQPTLLTAAATSGLISCFGGNSTVSVAGSGGTSPYNGTGTFSKTAGSYVFTITDNRGCTASASLSIVQPSALNASISTTPCSIVGGSNGSASVNVNGGTAPYSYLWSTSGTSQAITGINAGNYTVTITDANGCTAIASGTVGDPNCSMNVNANFSVISCYGDSCSITLNATNGVAPYTGTGTFRRLAGPYSFVVTDAAGCTVTKSGTISQPSPLSVTATAPAIRCNGDSTTLTVIGNGGTSPYSGTGTTKRTAGNYNVMITDANGCIATTTVNILQPAPLVANAVAGIIACNGGTTNVSVNGSGGVSPYTGTGLYSRNAGLFTYTINDANGCTAQVSGNITQPLVLTAAATPGAIVCAGGSAAVNITATGGTLPYSGTGTVNRTAGIHYYTVTDARGCSSIATDTITEPTALTVLAAYNAILCNGGTTSVTVTPSGGTSPYIGGGSFSRTAGLYNFTVTDFNGCTASASGSINQPPLLSASATSAPVQCLGATTSVTVNASGGTAPYTGTGIFYRSAGIYSFTVTDANGCTATAVDTVTQPTSALQANSIAGNIACYGGSTNITVTASGGISPYSGTGTFSRPAGNYTYTVTDASGCTATATGNISQPTLLTAVATNGNIACNGGTTTVTVTASGGTGPYLGTGTFQKSAGTYIFTVTDANGCTATISKTISQPTSIICNSTPGTINCFGGSTTISVTAIGGTGPYNGTGNYTATAGNYNYTVTDFNGCTATTSGFLSQPTNLVATAQAGSIRCYGGTTNVTISATGGTAPYSGTGVFNVTAGTYSYTVSDARGCVSTASANVAQPVLLTVNSTYQPILCYSGVTTITISASGGVGPYSGTGNFTQSAGAFNYSVTDANGCVASALGNITQPTLFTASASAGSIACFGQTTSINVSGSGGTPAYTGTGNFIRTAGNYTFVITDANGCTASVASVLNQPSSLSTTITTVAATTIGGNNGSASTSPVGGTAPYTYLWSSGATTATASGLSAGNYTVTITDARGCTTSATGTVGDPACNIILTITGTNVSCAGGTTNVTLSAVGGIAPYTGTGVFIRTAGPYNFNVTDANGCVAAISGTITEPSVLSATSMKGAISCFGGTTIVNITANGGTAPYTGTGNFTKPAGVYAFTITDANGCTATTSVTIGQPAVLTVSSAVTPIRCYGGTTNISVTASGGTLPYSGTGTYSVVAGGYNYTVTDANGCTGVTSGTITQPSQFIATATSSAISCYGGNTNLTVRGTGGTPPYSGTGVFNRPAGSYYYTITDANGCTSNVNGIINQPIPLVASSTTGTIRCFGGSTTVNVVASGGTSPYTGTGNFTRSAGLYSFIITDANGCTASVSGNISPPSQLIAVATPGTILCYGGQANITVAASGGTLPYMGTGNFIRSAGNYTFSVSDTFGCVATTNVNVTQPTALSISSSTGNIACSGGSTTITLTPSGGTSPYTGAGTFSVNSGPYSYTITDANACTATISGIISQPSPLTGTFTAGSITCFGGTTTVSVTATGGTMPYSGTGTFTRNAGPFSFIVTDSNGCSINVNGNINQPTPISVGVNTTPATTVGGNNGTASVNINGGTAPYTYQWSNSGSGSTIYNLTAGTYSVTITDANGCSGIGVGTVGDPLCSMVLSVSGTSIPCYGGNANVVVTASGGNPPYTGTGTFIRTEGNYFFTVTDNSGCSASINATVTQPSMLVATTSSGSILCYGGTTTINVSASGGNSPYIGAGAFAAGAGAYSYTITDANGCTATTGISVPQPSLLIASSNHGNISCYGQSTIATVTAVGGTLPYTGTGSFNVNAGPHTFTVTDANGCISVAIDSITQPVFLQATASTGTIACAGGTTTVNITANGGTLPYTGTGTYSRFAGNYTYTVTDLNGCTASTSGIITQPVALSAYNYPGLINCYGGTGTVIVGASGGNTPYTGTGTYHLPAGPYNYSITDANGCIATTSGNLTEPSLLQANATAGNITCYGGVANVIVSATGGTPPYSGTGVFTNTAGTYSYTVTDAKSCTATVTISLTQPSVLTASSTSTSISCNGGISTVSVTGTGGTLPYNGTGNFTVLSGAYSYNITDANGCTANTNGMVNQPSLLTSYCNTGTIACFGGTANVAVNAIGGTAPYTGIGNFMRSAGAYNFTVTDANGCTATSNTIITQPPGLGATMTTNPTTSMGGNDGTASALPVGGNGPFSYSWSNGASGILATGLTSGNYTVTITDANGCTASATGTVGNPNCNLIVNVNSSVISCYGGQSNVIVSASNGTSPYTGTGTFVRSAGPYNFTITDNLGCSAIVAGNISEPSALFAISTAGIIRCNGETTNLNISATGGTSPYSGTGNFSILAGNYTYTVLDANGCAATTGVNISQPNPIQIATSGSTILCHGDTANLVINANGGSLPYSGTGVFPRIAGTYYFTVTDANACSQTATITLSEPALLIADAGVSKNVCRGNSIVLGGSPCGSGGTGFLHYAWTPTTGLSSANVPNPIALPVNTSNYAVVVTDDNGCTAISSVTAHVAGPETPLFAVSPICNGEGNIVITNVSGSCQYAWSNGQNNTYTTVTDTGWYTLIISDTTGCTLQAQVNIGYYNNCGGILTVESDPFITVFDTLNVRVKIKNGVQIYSAFASIDFDATLLSLVDATPGNYFGVTSLTSPVINSLGHLSFGLSQSGGQPSGNGDGIIYSFRFVVKHYDSTLTFSAGSPTFHPTLFSLNNINVTDTNSIQPSSFTSISIDSSFTRIYYKADVWPGDLNNDHVSNVIDVLPIGYFYGLTGPLRPFASPTWSAQPAPLWGFDLSSKTSNAYRTFADANGDGNISVADKSSIVSNFGLQHARLNHSIQPPPNFQTLPSLAIDLPDTAVLRSNLPFTERATISIGDINQPVNNLYGVAFSIYFDPSFVNTSAVNVDFTGSIFGMLNTDFISVIDTSLIAAGKISVGMTRFNNSMVNGNGNMLAAIEFPLTTTAPSGWFVTAMEPLACNDNAGNSISLAGNSDSLQVIMNVDVPDATTEPGIIMYPNPVTDQLMVRWATDRMAENTVISIYDAIGHLVYKTRWTEKHTAIALADQVANGVYFVIVHDASGAMLQSRRIIVLRK